MSKIADFPLGWIGCYDDNEIEVVSTIPDPPKVRLAVADGKVESNLGGVSFNIRRDDGRHDEMGYLMGRLTADKRSAAIYAALAPARGQACREVFYIDTQQAVFLVPVIAPGGSRVSRFYTDHGAFCVNWQDDTGQPSGIVYKTHGSADESTWTAVGRIAVGPL